MQGYNVLRVGFTRFNFNYFATDEEVDYILDGVEFVARYGWMFLPFYEVDKVGHWTNKNEGPAVPMIEAIDYSSGEMKFPSAKDESLFGTLPF